jgi:hypothetical protein
MGRVQAVGPEHFGVLCFDCAMQAVQKNSLRASLI